MIIRSILMENCFWPGAYSFKTELKTLLEVLKNEIDIILKKINELDALAR